MTSEIQSEVSESDCKVDFFIKLQRFENNQLTHGAGYIILLIIFI